ncbi:hypothetical protein C8Q76DRAFT_801946 [Earliella scabrosa]|nr:hypothetical protein C8Q76DRAFT_801946 [Earliella scabrosa]
MSTPMGRKRVRTSSEAVAEPQAHKKDEEFWFEDGNIILVAADIKFRVYRGLLAAHSPVFHDMFSLPQPATRTDADACHDDTCPVVHLTDAPEDLRHILRAYMPQDNTMRLYDAKAPSFHAVSACIRLATSKSGNDWAPKGWDVAQVIGVVNLARFIEEPLILPTALMACTQLEGRILDGYMREDGTTEHLSRQDLALCVRAKTDIQKANAAVILRTLSLPLSSRCTSPTMCKAQVQAAFHRLHLHADDLVGGSPFLSYVTCVKNEDLGVCTVCTKYLNKTNWAERQDMWNRLPEILQIEVPGWVPPAEPTGA